MELPSAFSLLIILGTILTLFKLFNRKPRLNLPPGPPKYPIVGNLPQLAADVTAPHKVLSDLAKVHGPIMHLRLGEVHHIVITSAEAAKEVLKTQDMVFASRPSLVMAENLFYGCTDIALAPYGDYWRHVRKICTLELFTVKRVQSFRYIRVEEVSYLMKTLSSKAGSVVNLSDMLFSLLFDITLRMTLGKKDGSQVEAFKDLLEGIKPLFTGFALADLYPSLKWLLYTLSGLRSTIKRLLLDSNVIVDPIIEEHKSRGSDKLGQSQVYAEDIVDVLLKYQKDDPTKIEFTLTINNIKSIIIDLFSAGTETSSTTIEWAMSELLKNPNIMEKAQEEVRRVYQGKDTVDEDHLNELHFLKLIIKETLRLHPVVPFLLPRETLEKCQLYGYDIPSKTRVFINTYAIGRDPKYWSHPERFNPERFMDTHIDFKGTHFEYTPFGAGRRSCPGIALGVTSVEYILAMLLYHFDWKLPEGTSPKDLDMSESFATALKRQNDLCVIPTPYSSSTLV